MSEIHVFATIVTQSGKEDAMREVLVELAAASQTEPGVLHYMLHEDPAKPGNFYVFEAYKDADAVDAHMNAPHLAAAFAKAGPMVAAAPSIVQTKLIAGA